MGGGIHLEEDIPMSPCELLSSEQQVYFALLYALSSLQLAQVLILHQWQDRMD